MKEPQSSLQPVLERGSEFRASPHLHLPSKINHKPQSLSKPYSLIYTLSYTLKNPYVFMDEIHLRQSSWAPFVLVLSSYSLEHSSSHPKAKTHHTLISPLLWTEENSSSEHVCTADIHISVRWNLACHKAAPSFHRWTLVFASLLSGSGRLSPNWHTLKQCFKVNGVGLLSWKIQKGIFC